MEIVERSQGQGSVLRRYARAMRGLTDLRRLGALLALLASLAVAYLTYVTWLVFGISRSIDPTEKVGPLDGWGLLSVGAAVAIGLFCLGLKLAWRPGQSG